MLWWLCDLCFGVWGLGCPEDKIIPTGLRLQAQIPHTHSQRKRAGLLRILTFLDIHCPVQFQVRLCVFRADGSTRLRGSVSSKISRLCFPSATPTPTESTSTTTPTITTTTLPLFLLLLLLCTSCCCYYRLRLILIIPITTRRRIRIRAEDAADTTNEINKTTLMKTAMVLITTTTS